MAQLISDFDWSRGVANVAPPPGQTLAYRVVQSPSEVRDRKAIGLLEKLDFLADETMPGVFSYRHDTDVEESEIVVGMNGSSSAILQFYTVITFWFSEDRTAFAFKLRFG